MDDEAIEIRTWFVSYSKRLRMEYGQAMALVGFDPNLIVAVQQSVAASMIEWLRQS